MKGKKRVAALLILWAILLAAPMAMASEGAAAGAESRYDGFFSYVALACVVGLGLAAGGGGIGMGSAVAGVVNAMARNPGLYGKFFMILFIGLAFIESVVIYTLVVVLLLLYANPLL
ncbi:MAG: ATP synthase F0 subunit C [Nitrospinota bacterium]|nr:ATP synthase F0 subunit C [Nitrospinota bacterium]